MTINVKSETISWDAGPTGTTSYDLYVNGAKKSSTLRALQAPFRLNNGDEVKVVARPSNKYQSIKVGWTITNVPTPPDPTPPPATDMFKRTPQGFKISGVYDRSNDYANDWALVKALLPGITSMYIPSTVGACTAQANDRAKGWATLQLFSGYSDAQILSWATDAWNTGGVLAFYISDEPTSTSMYSTIQRWTQLLGQHFKYSDGSPVDTVVAHYDPSMIKALKGVCTVCAIDFYPYRNATDNWMNDVVQCVQAAESVGLRYTGVPQTFGGTGSYRLPTASELDAEMKYWMTTKSEGWYAYSWREPGAHSLSDTPALVDVLKKYIW